MREMARPSDAKSRFIETAAILFQQHGYNGVGLTELIEAANAPKGSFYHHFPGGKEELAEHSLRWAAAFISKHIDRSFESADSFAGGVQAFLQTVTRWLENSNWSMGCPILGVVVDRVPASARLSEVTQEVYKDWLCRIEAHALRLGIKDEPRPLAMRLLLAMEGAWIVSRAMRSAEPLKQAAQMFAEH